MSENEIYNGFCLAGGFERDHVFDRAFDQDAAPVGAYRICRCGDYRKKYCRCAECNHGHWTIIATNENEHLRHEIMKLNLRLAVLEGGPYMEPEKAADEVTQ